MIEVWKQLDMFGMKAFVYELKLYDPKSWPTKKSWPAKLGMFGMKAFICELGSYNII
jgi:hypothetical protein